MNTPPRKQRDWKLFAYIIPAGILLMLIAGQFAIYLSPNWSLSADMLSNLDPNFFPKRVLIEPVDPRGLTEAASNRTPNSSGDSEDSSSVIVIDANRPTFTARPSATPTSTVRVAPSVTRTSAPTTTATKRPTVIYTQWPTATSTQTPTKTPTRIVTATATKLKTPTTTATKTATVAVTATRTATVVGTATRTMTATITRTATVTATRTPTPTATKTGTVTSTPTATATYTATTTATATLSPTATLTPTATLSPTVTLTPTETATGTPTSTATSTPTPTFTPIPGDINIGPPDGGWTAVPDGSEIVVDLGANPIIVNDPADTFYDLVYYEWFNVDDVYMDCVILSISSDGITYYEIFNWCDDESDTNSNVSFFALGNVLFPDYEEDNHQIDYTKLYGVPPTLQTGILIDVDIVPAYIHLPNDPPGNVLSQPPAGSYPYLKIYAPIGGDGGADVDAIEVLEVPIPWP